jgi:DNA-binding Lrp family transcriptional regulator
MMSPHSSSCRPDLDDLDRAIVNRLQEGFPLDPNPFEIVACELGCTAPALINRLQRLIATGAATRFGPFFDAEAMGGAFCLCAMAVPPERFDAVAQLVNGRPEVAHNYEREHDLSMWFVLATERASEIDQVADHIERETGLKVLRFPKLEEYFIGFKVTA